MKLRYLILIVTFAIAGPVVGQHTAISAERLVSPDTSLQKQEGSNGLTRSEHEMIEVISKVDNTYLVTALCAIIDLCIIHFNESDTISVALAGWLRESHNLYTNRSPTEANQFRGFLIYSLSKLKPNDLLFHYVKYELQFGEYAFNVAAAAYTAKIFESRAEELVPLFTPYLNIAFRDELVDITTPLLTYPPINATRVRYEVLETLAHFGSDSYPVLNTINELKNYLTSNPGYRDSILVAKCSFASRLIDEVTPECCRKELGKTAAKNHTKLLQKDERQTIASRNINLVDQNGSALQFRDLNGKPFVLTFFYTRCANPLKCVSTVDRLARLQEKLTDQNTINKVGIYGMTFDPDFDRPSILRKYGQVYGMKFDKNVRFLLAADKTAKELTSQLQLRVNYGFGSVNLHGTQFYVFDKKGRLSLILDNENWKVDDVIKYLDQLVRE